MEFTVSRETCSLIIDHVTKAATSGSGYARGSGDKLAAVQDQWYVDRVRPFSELEAGEIELTRWKGRSGGLLRSHRFGVGDGEGNLTFRKLDPDETPEGKIDRAIIAYLKSDTVSRSQREVEAEVDGTAADVRDRLKALAQDPQRPVQTDESGRYPRFVYDASADHEPVAGLSISDDLNNGVTAHLTGSLQGDAEREARVRQALVA